MAERELNRPLGVVILAAGKGTRMESELSKVLHPVAGAPMLSYVLDAAKKLKPEKIVTVVGYQAKEVRKTFARLSGIEWAIQKEMKGTGDAVRSASGEFKGFQGSVLILYGDAPRVRVETLRRLVMVHSASKNAITMLTADLDQPYGYGRIVLHTDGSVARIVEENDATSEEKEITEINTGIGIYEAKFLFSSVRSLRPNNKKGELYLTDLVEKARREKKEVGRMRIRDFSEVLGINDRESLAEVSGFVYEEKAAALLASGVTLEEPSFTYIEPSVEVGKDTVVKAAVAITGKSKIGKNVSVGAHSRVEGSTVGSKVKIGNQVTVRNAKIGSGTEIDELTVVGSGS